MSSHDPQALAAGQRIVITGVGLTAPNGNNLAEFRAALLAGKSGVSDYEIRYVGKTLAGVCNFDELKYQKKKDLRRGTRAGSVGIYCANEAIVDRFSGGLDTGAEDSIRSASHSHSCGICRLKYLPGLGRGCSQRLLAINGLARRDCLERDLSMRCRDGQVEDKFDVVRLKQLIHAQCTDAVVGVGNCLGAGGIEVRDGHEVDGIQPTEVCQVLGDDGAAANDSYI